MNEVLGALVEDGVNITEVTDFDAMFGDIVLASERKWFHFRKFPKLTNSIQSLRQSTKCD